MEGELSLVDNAPVTYFLVMGQKTAFFRLKDIFPECFLYREKSPMTEPLVCLRENACHVGHGCMDTLIKRLKMLFDLLPQAQLIYLYYAKRNIPGMGAGIFWRGFKEFKVITMNQGGWKRLKLRGDVMQFHPDPSFFLSADSRIGPDPEAAQTDKKSELTG